MRRISLLETSLLLVFFLAMGSCGVVETESEATSRRSMPLFISQLLAAVLDVVNPSSTVSSMAIPESVFEAAGEVIR